MGASLLLTEQKGESDRLKFSGQVLCKSSFMPLLFSGFAQEPRALELSKPSWGWGGCPLPP